ncbi:MAG: polysaccharide biosynthesis tyrosine autokinase [Phycisphaerales bacterium]|nr:polysaccharide biosynthesis tyrosine autokinase [Phycisphaerales bacterium]
MTTLPTTTAVRVPRPAAQTALGLPQAAVLAPPGMPASAGTMTANDILRVLRANAWLIILSLVVSAIIGLIAWRLLLKYYPRYTAVGFVRVETPRTFVRIDNEEREIPDVGPLGIMARTQAQLLQNPTLFSTVLQDVNREIQNTEWIAQFRRANGSLDVAKAREDLEDHFSVSPIQDSQLIRVSMTCKNPKDARIIVQDLVNEHLNSQDKARRDRTTSRNEQLQNIKRRLDFNINQKNVEIRSAQKELNDNGMAVVGRMSPRETELYELTRKVIELKAEHEQAKQQYDLMVNQINQGNDPPLIEQYVNQDGQVFQLRNAVNELEIALKSMPMLANNSRLMEQYRARLAATQQQLDDRIAEVKVNARNTLRSNAEQSFAYTQSQLEALNERMNALKSELGELNYKIFEVMTKQEDLASDKERLKQVQTQIDLLSITGTREQTGVNWAGPVDEPELPSFPKLRVVLPVALLCGLGLSLAIAFLREAMDTTVRSPRDIAKVGQLNLLGMIPDENDDPQVEGIPLALAIFHAPTSMLAEQFRQVRTRLQHSASLETTRSILVTSPSPGDGKTTIATNIAAGLALNGRRILLVDVNFRRPMVDKVFATGNEVGLSNVIHDLRNFENAIRSTQVPNLDILPCGPKPANATEMLESQGFKDFVEKALETYDHVIFDSGPLLLVSETVSLAPRVDGVITVVRAATNTRGLLQRMRDTLRQIKAEHLGVVLNGVRAQGGGYYGRNIRDYYEYQNGQAK